MDFSFGCEIKWHPKIATINIYIQHTDSEIPLVSENLIVSKIFCMDLEQFQNGDCSRFYFCYGFFGFWCKFMSFSQIWEKVVKSRCGNGEVISVGNVIVDFIF